jgi:hypothetical protein
LNELVRNSSPASLYPHAVTKAKNREGGGFVGPHPCAGIGWQ